MEIKIETTYEVSVFKTNKIVIEDTELDKYLENPSKHGRIMDTSDLKEYILDYMWELDLDLINPEDRNSLIEDSEEITVTNLEELLEKYSYKILKDPDTKSCCNNPIYENFYYCPICGSKL